MQRALHFLNKNVSVILISSTAAHIGWPGYSLYSSTKAAVSYLAQSFSSTKAFEKLADNIPLKRFAASAEIAEVAFFLASARSSYSRWRIERHLSR